MTVEKKLPDHLERGGIEDGNVVPATGKLAVNIPLFELSGISPSYSLELDYNYSINSKMSFEKWNDLWTPEEVGINWSINKPDKIVRVLLEENAATVEELIRGEKFYWVSSGGLMELCHLETIDIDSDTKKLTYVPRGSSDIIIERTLNTSELYDGSWKISYPSGEIYKFDLNEEENEDFLRVKSELEKVIHQSSTVKSSSLGKEVLWKNGMWFTKYLSMHEEDGEPINQNEIINEWNLTSINDPWGNSTKFYYISEVMPVGENGKEATVCSYLYKIENSNGNKLILNYKARDSKEIIKKHRICEDPNGYQEKLEKLFLTSVDMVQREGVLRKAFEYTEINSDTDYSKRILSKIKSKIYSKDTSSFIEDEPSYLMEYYDQKDGVSNL